MRLISSRVEDGFLKWLNIPTNMRSVLPRFVSFTTSMYLLRMREIDRALSYTVMWSFEETVKMMRASKTFWSWVSSNIYIYFAESRANILWYWGWEWQCDRIRRICSIGSSVGSINTLGNTIKVKYMLVWSWGSIWNWFLTRLSSITPISLDVCTLNFSNK